MLTIQEKESPMRRETSTSKSGYLSWRFVHAHVYGNFLPYRIGLFFFYINCHILAKENS